MKYFNSGICPICHNKLKINRISCPECKAEYPINEPLTPYDYLTESQMEFLNTFLKCRGSLKAVAEEFNSSYPTVKNRLDNVLIALGFLEINETEEKITEVDMSKFGTINRESKKASDIIKAKLYDNGGTVVIPLLNGEPCNIVSTIDGTALTSDKLNKYQAKYEYIVFDIIVNLLHEQGGRAAKGCGRGKGNEYKVGNGKCSLDTVVGTVAHIYSGVDIGKSAFDPVFVLAAVMDWAGIARNCRGYLELI